MKLKTKKEEQPQESAANSWPEVKEQFVDLKEANLAMKLMGSVMICDQSLRPYLSRTAKAEGIRYFTLGVGGHKMLVIRHKPLKKKLVTA
jgi:hypothetical protein